MRARSLLCVLAFVGLLVAAPTAMAYEFFPDAKSQMQRDWESLFTKIFWAALVVFVLVEGIILYAIIRFRKRKDGPSEGPHIHGNTKMEIAWTIAPTLVMAWLLMVSVTAMGPTDTDRPTPDFEVQVIARQFAFDFYYPGSSDPSVNELRVQEDVVVGLSVTSSDVIHAINIPELGVMIDATPGRMNSFWFQADEPGEYMLQCRELCGVGHGAMRFPGKIVVFAAGSQERPYGEAENVSGTTSPSPTPTSTNATSGPNGTTPAPGGAGEPQNVRLFDFGIDPEELTLEPGKSISFNVLNDGKNQHNLFIGKFDTAAANNGATWFTSDLAAGQSQILDVQLPEEAGAWEWWCDVPGHRESGMVGVLSTGGTLVQGPGPLLPGFELPLVLLAALGVAFVVSRRRR